METYEKKYKEANDKIAARFGTNIAKEIFTDLYESEDEKIRKEIISFIQDHIDEINLQVSGDYDTRDIEDIALQEWCKKAIAWLENIPYTIDHEKREGFRLGYKAGLEKQGEQKPIDKIQLGKKYKCIASPRYSTFRRGNIYKPVDNFLCNLMNLCYECFEPIEDSEQKPSDEDMKEALRTEYEKGRADAFVQMQKKWSDEDDDDAWMNDIISKVENNLQLNKAEIDWLKSLKDRVQPIHEYSDTEKQEMFIKSQRPHFWRPSDEQMKALKYVAYHLMPDNNYREEMFSLYEDLKKLKA